jgi:hypothetical protein
MAASRAPRCTCFQPCMRGTHHLCHSAILHCIRQRTTLSLMDGRKNDSCDRPWDMPKAAPCSRPYLRQDNDLACQGTADSRQGAGCRLMSMAETNLMIHERGSEDGRSKQQSPPVTPLNGRNHCLINDVRPDIRHARLRQRTEHRLTPHGHQGAVVRLACTHTDPTGRA